MLRIAILIGVFLLVPISSSLRSPSLMYKIEGGIVSILAISANIFIGIIWKCFPDLDDFEDAFFIRHELKTLFLFVIAGHLVVIPANIGAMWFDVATSWYYLTLQLLLSGLISIMVIYPKRRILTVEEKMSAHLMFTRRASVDTANPEEHWKEVISTKKGYEDFCNYMAQQFALEVLE